MSWSTAIISYHEVKTKCWTDSETEALLIQVNEGGGGKRQNAASCVNITFVYLLQNQYYGNLPALLCERRW